MKAALIVFSLAMINFSCVMGMKNQLTLDDMWKKREEPPLENQLHSLIQDYPLHQRSKKDIFECIERNTDESGKVSWSHVKNGLNNLGYVKPLSMKQAGFLTALSLCNFIYGINELMIDENNLRCIGNLYAFKLAAQFVYFYNLLYMLARVPGPSDSKDFYSKPLHWKRSRFGEADPVNTMFLMCSKASIICPQPEGVYLRNDWNSIETLLAAATLMGQIMYLGNIREWSCFTESDKENLEAFQLQATRMIDKEIELTKRSELVNKLKQK